MKNSGLGRALVAMGVALALSTATAPGQAQTEEERAGARAAATEGAQAFQEGRWQEAVDLFERAESLVHAPPHQLYLARAHEKLGHLVKARELYNKIVRETLPPGAPEAFRKAQTDAEQELQAIEPRLAKLTVKVTIPENLPVKVTMDGEPVPSALVGIPRPVDPGSHEVVATADGYRAEPLKVTLAEGAKEVVTLELVKDASAPVASPPPAAPAGTAPSPEATTPPASAPAGGAAEDGGGGGNGLRIGAYAALGVGVVGVGLGTVFGLSSAGKRSDADALEDEFLADCGDRCLKTDPRAEEIDALDADAKSARTLATVGFVVGGVGLATGATLFILSGSKREAAARRAPHVRGWVGVGSVGLSGSF